MPGSSWERRVRRPATSPPRATRTGAASAARAPPTSASAACSPASDARVEPGIGEVDQYVGADDRDRRHDHAGRDDRAIAVEHRLDAELSEAGPAEDRLGHDRPAHQRAEVKAR